MKGLMIAAVLGVLIVALCWSGIGYVNHATIQLENHLQTCLQYANQEQWKQAKTALAGTQAVWQQERMGLMMIADQAVLDDIEDMLSQMGALLEHHPDEFVPTGVLCQNKCKELRQRENLSLYSWF